MSDKDTPDNVDPIHQLIDGTPVYGEDVHEVYQHDREYANQLERTLQQEVPGQDVSRTLLDNDLNNPNSWLHTNKGYEQRGYTPASRLDTENVESLNSEWVIGGLATGLRCVPIVVPSDPPVMYFTEGDYTTHAVNARTGEHYWKTQPQVPDDPPAIAGSQRGVAIAGDKVFLTLPTVEIVAFDRYTGKKEWRSSIYTEQQRQEMGKPGRISITQAPLVYDGKVYCGNTGDFGGWGAVNALNAETGDIVWQHDTVVEEDWVGDSWHYASSCAWMTGAVDPKSDTVFWSVGNPNPMMNPIVRPGPNKDSNSLMAFDAQSGEVKWATQIFPHEMWDYDVDTIPLVFDMEVNGETKRVVNTDPKAGWSWYFDVDTGELVSRSEPYVRQNHEWSPRFLAMPPRGRENRANFYPSDSTEWPPDAYSPQTGLRYIGTNDAPMSIFYDPNWQYNRNKIEYQDGGGKFPPVEPYSTFGYVTAIEPASGEIEWQHRLEGVQRDWSESRAWTGGTLATGGNLVFHGSSSGYLVGLGADDGQRVWRQKLAERITAKPMSWDDPKAGKQFVAVAANDKVVAFSGGD